jgi:hypothetical protein
MIGGKFGFVFFYVCRWQILSFSNRYISILYEIYPQSESPLLTQIARLECIDPPAHLLTDTLVYFHEDRMVFRVWDYRSNYSTCFSTDIDVTRFKHIIKVFSVLSKMLKLALTDSLGRHSQRRQPLSCSLKKEYSSGPSHLYYLILPTTFSTTIQPIYHRSSEFHSRMTLFASTSLIGRQSLPGILDLGGILGNPSISTLYIRIPKLIGSN